MNLNNALGKAKKFAAGHQKQVDEAINKAAQVAKQHAPSSVDGAIDKAALKAKDEL